MIFFFFIIPSSYERICSRGQWLGAYWLEMHSGRELLNKRKKKYGFVTSLRTPENPYEVDTNDFILLFS